MFSVNKFLFSSRSVLNRRFKLIFDSEVQKRFLNSAKQLTNCSLFNRIYISEISLKEFSVKCSAKRYLTSEASSKSLPKKPNQKITRITSKSSSDNAIKVNDEAKEPAVKASGILDVNQWKDMNNVQKWICVYHFPYISQLRTFQRIKLYLTVFNIALVPLNLVLYSYGSIAIDALATYSALSVFSVIAMYMIGNMFRCFVGRIYISEDEKYVRLSHLTFFGNRLNDVVDREDVVPLMDSNHKLDDFYCAIERYSTSGFLYMSLKFGGIVDTEGFEKIFGEDLAKFLNN